MQICDIFEDINDSFLLYNKMLNEVVDEHAP